MKNLYKLIVTNEHYYQEVSLYKLNETENTEGQALTHLLLPSKEDGVSISIAVSQKGATCCLESMGNLLFRNKNGSVDRRVSLSCGDAVQIIDASGSQVLYQFEMVLYSVTKNNGDAIDFNFGFEMSGELSIGGSRCTVTVQDSLMGSDYISFVCSDNKIFIKDFRARYGLFVNGTQVKNMCTVENYSLIVINGIPFYLKDGFLYTDSEFGISVSDNREQFYRDDSLSKMKYPKFNRSTRIHTVLSEEPIDVLAPPAIPQKPKTNLLVSLLPSLAMLILIVVVRGFISSGTGTYIIFSACMMGVGIVTSIVSFVDGRRNYKKSLENRKIDYNNYIQRKREEITVLRQDEKNMREEIYHDLNRSVKSVKDFTAELFDRSITDNDFLQVYLGVGDVPASREITYKKREQIETDDDLGELPERLRDELKYIHNAPVTADFLHSRSIGLIGNERSLYTMMKNITIDIAVRHYYRDVKLLYIVNPDYIENIEWLRWLPHLNNEDLDTRNIVCDNESKTELLEYLYNIMSSRLNQKVTFPHLVVFVLMDIGIKTHPISQFFDRSNELGVTFVFFEKYAELLPDYCDEIIILESEHSGKIVLSEDSKNVAAFSFPAIEDHIASQTALKLSPVYCEEISLEHQLRKGFTFFEMFNICSIDQLNLSENWKGSDATKSLAAPIGINAKEELVYLDLHENAHGPHGLIAGTTGSGKSEVILSYILSMALNYPPEEVSFFIIDFKGGGIANKLVKHDFPHLVGTITNIDDSSIDRSLLSINAEKQKRLRLFAEFEVEKIDDYIVKYRSGESKIALPHLIIIVDEFAELKAAQPDFMQELISLARVGRSLGIHLILATQKPAGQVSDQIWSNSRFKICLKVQDQSDSNEVLKSPLAAEIREPGRAYLQVGNNELFELFQSGYSGAPVETGSGSSEEFVIKELSLSGKKRVIYQTRVRSDEEKMQTQSNQLIAYITDFCRRENIPCPGSMCLPELPEVLPYERKVLKDKDDILVCLGICDDPENQVQNPIALNVTSGNTIIIGSAQSGKTNVLQTIIRGLAENYTPDDVNIYIIDFNSMILRRFESLPHVGGVVCMNEDEKLKNLFKLLDQEIKRRKKIILDAGKVSFSKYREAGYRDIPQIVLLVDNYTSLRETYLFETDCLLPICMDGLGVGISVVISNSQMTGFGFRYMSNFSSRIALYCNDSGDYSALLEYSKVRPKDIPGDAIITVGKRKLNGKIALAFEEVENEPISDIQSFVDNMVQLYRNQHVKYIPMIPQILLSNEVEIMYKNMMLDTSIVLGLDYDTVSPVCCDLKELGILGVLGKPGFGKTNFLYNIIDKCVHMKDKASLYIIDDFKKKLSIFKNEENICRYTLNIGDVSSIIQEIEQKLEERYYAYVHDEEPSDSMIVLIASHPDVLTLVSSDMDSLLAFKNIIGKYRGLGVCMIFNNIENSTVSYSAPETIKILKDNNHFLFFDNISNMKFLNISYSAQKANKKEIEIGDAFYIKGTQCNRIKTARYIG